MAADGNVQTGAHPLVLLQQKILCKTGQDFLSGCGAIRSPWRGEQSCDFSSPDISSSLQPGNHKERVCLNSLVKRLMCFPLPRALAALALFCLNNNSRKYQGLPSLQ